MRLMVPLNKRKDRKMTKLSWAVVCVLVVFNSAAIVAGFRVDVRGAGCIQTECEDGIVEYNECLHFTDDDPCETNRCIKNYEYYPRCPSNAETDEGCPVEEDPRAIACEQIVRFASCTTGNPTEWTRHESGNPCWELLYETRCEAGGCQGLVSLVGGHLGRNVCK